MESASSPTTVQAERCLRVRRDFLCFQAAAEAVVRGVAARQSTLASSALRLQAVERAKRGRRDFRSCKAAAVAVQALVRGVAARRSTLAFHSAVLRLQAVVRGHRGQRDFRSCKAAAVAVQALVRGVAARRSTLALISAVLRFQALLRGRWSRRRPTILRLQTWYRQRRCQRRFQRILRLAVRVQTLLRAVTVRTAPIGVAVRLQTQLTQSNTQIQKMRRRFRGRRAEWKAMWSKQAVELADARTELHRRQSTIDALNAQFAAAHSDTASSDGELDDLDDHPPNVWKLRLQHILDSQSRTIQHRVSPQCLHNCGWRKCRAMQHGQRYERDCPGLTQPQYTTLSDHRPDWNARKDDFDRFDADFKRAALQHFAAELLLQWASV